MAFYLLAGFVVLSNFAINPISSIIAGFILGSLGGLLALTSVSEITETNRGKSSAYECGIRLFEKLVKQEQPTLDKILL
jgi:NADH:ubiquinone oxidoreductase subunit 3 (subunit A)